MNGSDGIRGTTALLDDVLSQLQQTHGIDAKISLGQLTDALQARAYGVILLLMALPCCLPFVYLLPQIVAFPMLFLTWQLASGRNTVWLPENLHKRQFRISLLAGTVSRARPWLKRFEFIAGPRLASLSEGIGLRIVGGLLMIPCASILVPLPLTNSVPGLGVSIAAIGLVERDGVLILLGLIIGLVWVAALAIGGGALLTYLIDLATGLVSSA
ncbi:MAG: exopolysaccharide biosynthesis protein [Ahrensia sp.]|nr:exopolysaccharide biosynthesis protein [Ahrensia sp.]